MSSLIERNTLLEPSAGMGTELDLMGRDMERLFGDFFGGRRVPSLFHFSRDLPEWKTGLRVDVRETEGEYVLSAEVPGFTKDQLHVDVTEEGVTLTGERTEDKEREEGRYVCRESSFGSFKRSFRLPSQVRVEGVEAKLKDGVLRLVLPKQHTEQHKQIEITAEEG